MSNESKHPHPKEKSQITEPMEEFISDEGVPSKDVSTGEKLPEQEPQKEPESDVPKPPES